MKSFANASITSTAGLAQRKKVIFFLLKILIAAGLLIFLIFKINFSEFTSVIRHAKLSFLLTGFSLLFVNLFLQYKKWELTCGNYLQEKNKKKILYSLFAGLSAGTFTPARVGEYFGRAVAFKNQPLMHITVATFIDKFYPLIIVAFVGSISSILFIFYYYHAAIYLTVALLILLFIIFYAVIYLLIKPGQLDALLGKIFTNNKKINSLLETINLFRNANSMYSVKMILISLLFYLCYIFQFSFLVAAYEGNYDFIHYFWAGNLVMFTKTLIPSISFAELGIREGASIYFLGSMGLTSIVAFNASITLFFINVLLPSITGLFFLMKKDYA